VNPVKATFVDLRKKSGQIIRALKRNESVTIYYRGEPTAVMQPVVSQPVEGTCSARSHPAFGMWSKRRDLQDPAAYVRRLRRSRLNAL
jgi:antitoxin (DNA-binding transcriptional repressor) of toxin-antitoxin stability system